MTMLKDKLCYEVRERVRGNFAPVGDVWTSWVQLDRQTKREFTPLIRDQVAEEAKRLHGGTAT